MKERWGEAVVRNRLSVGWGLGVRRFDKILDSIFGVFKEKIIG